MPSRSSSRPPRPLRPTFDRRRGRNRHQLRLPDRTTSIKRSIRRWCSTRFASQLLSAMRTAGVKNAALPAMHASDAQRHQRPRDRSRGRRRRRRIESEVHDARSRAIVALDGMMHSVNDRYTVFLTPKDFAGLNRGPRRRRFRRNRHRHSSRRQNEVHFRRERRAGRPRR